MPYVLTDSQVTRIGNAIRRVEHSVDDVHFDPLPEQRPVWIYIAKSTTEIEAIEGNTPGKGKAKLYELDLKEETLDPKALEPITVYNTTCHYVPAGSWILLRRDPYSGNYFLDYYECLTSSNAGCGITISSGIIAIDNTDLAGKGLIASLSGCALDVNIGCGLRFGASGAIEINPADLAGDGLTVSSGGCGLAINIGTSGACGLGFVSGALTFDVSQIVGNGLKIGSGACALEVDVGCGLVNDGVVEIDTDVADVCNFDIMTNVNLSVSGAEICLTKRFATLEFEKNDCGVLIGCSIAGGRTETQCITSEFCLCPPSGSSSGSTPSPSSSSSAAASIWENPNPELTPFWEFVKSEE